MGWGLRNVKTSNSRITDKRFNLQALDELQSDGIAEQIPRIKEWLNSQQGQEEAIRVLAEANSDSVEGDGRWFYESDVRWLTHDLNEKDSKELSSFFVHQGEYGIPRVAVFVPIAQESWQRYDDSIDYYENDRGGSRNKNSRMLPNSGIYPYQGVIRIPNRPPLEGYENWPHFQGGWKGKRIEPATYSQLIGTWLKDRGPEADGPALSDLVQNYRARIEPSIIVLSHYLKLFAKWDAIHDLRPMIYTYWS